MQIKKGNLSRKGSLFLWKGPSVMSREKVSQTEITKALKGASKAGFKVQSLERRADGFLLHFDQQSPPRTQPLDENEWDDVK